MKFDGRPFKLYDVTVINFFTNPALVTRRYIRKDVESPAGCFNDALIIESALPLKDIYPIPLTAEILEKNGWKVEEKVEDAVSIYRQKFTDDWGEVEIRVDCDPYSDYHLMHKGKHFCYVNFVHELQHALRLCKIEKEIVL